MNNYIGLDISLNSTAVFIESNKGQFVLSFTNKKDNNIYIKELDRCGVIFQSLEKETSSDYSKNEILKLKQYISISDSITQMIKRYIDENEKTFCQIEGYSFSKNTSSILDIVGLSTLIRAKFLKEIVDIDITIIAPKTLKLEVCKMVYPPINVGVKKPKWEYRNPDGISGGSFKKPQMFKAMIDGQIQSPIYDMLVTYKHLMDREKIPNPIEDIIDAIFACKLKIKEISR